MGLYPPQLVSTYTTLTSFPALTTDGSIAIALDTDYLYIFNLATTTWRLSGGPGSVLSLGAVDGGSASAANGASIVADVLYLQSASATVPGLVNTTTQTLAGVKTFSSAPNLSSLSASLPLQLDGSKNITAVAIDLSGTQATGTLAAGRFPALTGDVTTTAGSLSTALVATTNATLTTISSLVSVGTITTGTWSATTIAVNKGGTGLTSGTSGGVLAYTASGTLTSSGALIANQLVIGGGAGVVPSSLAAGSQYQVLVMGASNPGYGQLNLSQSAAVTGTLLAAQFPALTGDVTTSAGALATALVATTNATLTIISTLVSVGTITTGTWSATTIAVNKGGTGLTSGTSGGVLAYTASGTLASSGALTASQLVLGGGAGVAPSSLAAGSQYQVLRMGATTPAYGTINLDQSAAVTGTLPIGNGGTGVTSVTIAPTATAFAGWDANSNMSANSHITGYATTATAAGTTTLTVSSKQQQYFTGSTTQTVVLPVASTLVLGQTFYIANNSTGSVTVNSSGSNAVQVMTTLTSATFTCILTSGTSAASWNVEYTAQAAGTVTSVAMTVPTFLSISGSPVTTSGTLAVTLSGTALPVANGGTGLTSGTSGGVLAYTASGTLASSGALTANQLIIGGGAGVAPSTLAAGSQYQVLVMGASNPGYGQLNLSQSAAVTGTLLAAQFPALTGDVTTSAGALATALVATTNGTLTTISTLVSVGTITTGTWSATTIAVNKGGTGLTSGTSGGVLAYTASGTLASSGALTASQLIIGGGAGVAPSSLAAGSQYQSLTMGASNPGYSAVALNQAAAISGTLPIGNGGTGVTSVTIAPTATAFAGWDANSNLSTNSLITGYATTATAAGTTTLTVASKQQQYFTGSTTQTVTLPVASTLVLGQTFYVANNSSGVVTVNSSGSNAVQVMGASSNATFTCILTSGTSAASWNVEYSAASAGTVTSVAMTVPTFLSISGSPVTTSGTLAVTLSGTALPVANGGTGVTTSTGSTNVVLSNSPTLVSPLLGTPTSGNLSNCTSYPNVTQSVAGLVVSAGQLLGTNTNDAGSAGNVGELLGPISRVRSNATSVTTATPKNVATTTNIVLTAGDWQITAMGVAKAAGTTVISEFDLAISATSATLPGTDTIAVPTSGEVWCTQTNLGTGAETSIQIAPYRVSVANAATKTLYLVANVVFSVSTCTVYGSMEARRMR